MKMRKALFLYNPQSGPNDGHLHAVQRAAAILRDAGVETSMAATLSSAEAGNQAKNAIAQGCDTIFACGGDGTIQDVAQGLVGESAALALIPLGTANVLAHDLGIAADPERAAHAALDAVALRVSVGHVACRTLAGVPVSRYFLSVAGVGLDGYLFQQLEEQSDTRGKKILGLTAYLFQAFQVWRSYPMRQFAVMFATSPEDVEHVPVLVTQLLAVRIRDFGNLLRRLAPGASLLRHDFRVVLFETPSRWSYLLYVLRVAIGLGYGVRGVELRDTASLCCDAVATGGPIYIEADGDLLGQLPAEISIVPDALILLVPRDFASRQR